MERRGSKSAAAYVGLIGAAGVLGILASFFFGAQLDRSAYDHMFRLYRPPPWQPESTILAIDEASLSYAGGMGRLRGYLAHGLRLVAAARPKAVAIDVTLTDRGENIEDDTALAEAFRNTPNLILCSLLMDHPLAWEDPQPAFRQYAAAIGHVHAEPDDEDSVTRSIALEKVAGTRDRWALAFEAYRLSHGSPKVIQSPSGLQVGSTEIPIRWSEGAGYSMRIRYAPPYVRIPTISLKDLLENRDASQFTGKVVFVGVTAVTEVRDRLFTPYSYGQSTTGIEINANAFETIAHGVFLTDVRNIWVLVFSLGLVAAAGLAFRYLPGWWAYAGGLAVVAAAVITPYLLFTRGLVFSLAEPLAASTFAVGAAASYYTLVVRRNWRREEAARTRYQQAMHFVTHEMRTPLSAIQGSSELISRYALTEDKRKQIAQLINSESKRLARMVEIFLNVERLSAGQMELKREPITVKEMVSVCVERTRPLAERKHIALTLTEIPGEFEVTGDRELMEYACYNLLTNAVKYSPQRTEVTVTGWKDDGHIRIAVKDQGIGMDQKEVKQIFQKFYRTKKAEESGEAGTGIGLSIVQQIVEQHGGQIEVTSQPGAGSCFTLVLPAGRTTGPVVHTAAERH